MPDERDPPLLLPIEVVPMGDDLVTVLVRGEIDLVEAGELRAVLNDACAGSHRSVLVDLSGVTFLGTSGLGVLTKLSQLMRDQGRSLVIRGCTPKVRRVFEVTGLSDILDVG